MTEARDLMQKAAAWVSANPEKASAIDAVYKFVLSGEGGGTWLADFGKSPKIVEDDGDADCILRLSAEDCVELLTGDTPPQRLFFAGRLKVEGNLPLALKLGTLKDLFA